LLPLENNSTTGDQASIDEERRLFYVGITRAKVDLHMSYSKKASRFLVEAGLAL
jgi:DNA helicase-2/ATP-dependent DNA helicase PcrA